MDDLWGDDIDADVVEECVMLATQASICLSPKVQKPQEASFTDCKHKNVFEFKQPTQKVFQPGPKTKPTDSKPFTITTESKTTGKVNTYETIDLQHLKDENQKLIETNLIKNGETTILRADLQNLRTVLEKREAEASQQLASLRKQVQQMDLQHSKQLEASKTEMKFKELELEELRNKCRKIEQNVQFSKDQKNIKTTPTPVHESPSARKFLNKTAFEEGKHAERKRMLTVDAGIQTESLKPFRLDSSDNERLDNTTDTAILIETLKFSLLSSTYNSALSYTTVLEQLKMKLISDTDHENLTKVFHGTEPSVAEMICCNLERVKSTDRLKLHIEFLSCWITHILPRLDISKQDRFIQIVLSEIRRTSFLDIMSILSAIVAYFGLAPICNRQSGCLLEKAALSLKDSYLTLKPEEQFQAAQKLVLTLSTMLASPPSENLKKCACIPHLLKSLVFVVQHQTELEGLTPYAADRRLKMLVQAFRLSLSILSSRREPWLTFKHSAAEVNRLYTVLTVLSVDFPIPEEIRREINVSAFTQPGFGL